MDGVNVLWAGIETGKDKCDVEIIDNDENTVKVFEFENRNTENGFKKVKRIADALSKNRNAFIVFSHEPTSEYHANIRNYLVKNGYIVIKLEAKHSKKFRALFNDRAKTDKIDKNILARELKFFYEKDIQKTIKERAKNNNERNERNELKDLTRFRSYIVKERSKFKNKLKINSFLLFPEMEDIFTNFFGKGAMYINKNYMTPEDILKVNEEQLKKELAENSNNVFGKNKAKEIIKAAENASGLSSGISGLKITKRIMIDILERLNKHVKFLDKEIEKRIKNNDTAEIILSVPGAGMVLASTFIAETSGLKFESERDFISFCGLCSSTNKSSKLKKDGRIVDGNKSLRMAFIQAVNSCIRSDRKGNPINPHIKNYYNRKQTEYEKTKYGKTKAKIASAAKLAGIIFAMVKKRQKYDQNYEIKMKVQQKQRKIQNT